LEVWVDSYNINFHCDFLKFFLEMEECTNFARINIYFLQDPKKKNNTTMSIFFNRLSNYKYTKITSKEMLNFFSL
jgi:hypothetical protein